MVLDIEQRDSVDLIKNKRERDKDFVDRLQNSKQIISHLEYPIRAIAEDIFVSINLQTAEGHG